MFNKTKAFTIVEILITIGIIGVVAAITIPVLLQNTNSKKFSTQFKKSLSTLAQAAVTSIAQYDMDYSTLTQDSNNSDCASDTFGKAKYTMCALFNSTLAGKNYQGVYGQVKGASLIFPYSVSATTSSFNPEGYMLYSLADGAMVGFKPTAKGCSLTAGSTLNSSMLASGGGLSDCIGFIDVNGVHGPNKEVTCTDGTSEFSTSTCALRKSGSGINDVFPIVFHDGTVEPATNAARAILTRGTSTAEPEPTQTTTEHGYKIGKRNDPSTWEAFKPTTALTKEECKLIKEDLGIQACRNDDYWAAAVKECGGTDKILTDDDLYELAKTIYPTCDDSTKSCSGTPDFSNIPENLSGLGSSWRVLWTGSEKSSYNAYVRGFYNSYSYGNSYTSRDDSFAGAVCVSD